MRNSRLVWIVIFIFILLIAGGVGFNMRKNTLTVKAGKRQAVYLANGQVYFGYMGNPNDEYIALSDPFYPQSEQSATTSHRTITLNPLGETYTTENVMYINRKQILHFENLAGDSKVNTAIDAFKKNPSNTPTPSPNSSAPSPTPTY